LKAILYDLLGLDVGELVLRNRERYLTNVLKFLVYCFQTVEDLKFTKKMFNLLNDEGFNLRLKCLEAIAREFSIMSFSGKCFWLGCKNSESTCKNANFSRLLKSL
jgi:hypothetical protein